MTTFSKLKESLKANIDINSFEDKKTKEDNIGIISKANRTETILYEDWGFEKAKNLNASNTGLLACLALLREDHKQMVQRDENLQQRLKEPIKAALKSHKEQEKDKEREIENIEKEVIPDIENKIDNLVLIYK